MLIQMEEEEVKALFAKWYTERPRDRPAYWDDERYKNPVQPVVGVNWYEALAYCHWLEEQLQVAGCTLQIWRNGRVETCNLQPATCNVRLPSEAEWEAAARGKRGWLYPWGNRWDAARANTWEGHVLRPTPVGIYPGGETPEGIHEMAGNVGEWTRSLYQPYPYQSNDGREDLSTEGYRVVRGGSWYYRQGDARCACRGRDFPGLVNDLLGLRVVVSLAL